MLFLSSIRTYLETSSKLLFGNISILIWDYQCVVKDGSCAIYKRGNFLPHRLTWIVQNWHQKISLIFFILFQWKQLSIFPKSCSIYWFSLFQKHVFPWFFPLLPKEGRVCPCLNIKSSNLWECQICRTCYWLVKWWWQHYYAFFIKKAAPIIYNNMQPI